MSQENVELVRAAFEAWNRGELEAVLRNLDQELVCSRAPPLPSGTFHGPEGLLELAAEFFEDFDDWSVQAEHFLDAGDRVVVRVLQQGTGAASGIRVEQRVWDVFTVRAGKLIRLDLYATETQALEAVGLSE